MGIAVGSVFDFLAAGSCTAAGEPKISCVGLLFCPVMLLSSRACAELVLLGLACFVRLGTVGLLTIWTGVSESTSSGQSQAMLEDEV